MYTTKATNGTYFDAIRVICDDVTEIKRDRKDHELDGQTSFYRSYFYISNVWMVRERT